MDPEVRAFAESFRRFVERMTELAYSEGGPSALRARLDAHVGADSATLPVVAEEFPAHDHANVRTAGMRTWRVSSPRTAPISSNRRSPRTRAGPSLSRWDSRGRSGGA